MVERMDQMGLTKAEYLGKEMGSHTYKAWDHYSNSWVIVRFYDNGIVHTDYGVEF